MEISEFLLLLFLIVLIIILVSVLLAMQIKHNKNNKKEKKGGSCDIKSCGALDPVSNPAYNMQQIVKQSILLEEHITNKNKRCRDCITKHFLHIIGLAEEAQMLATDKCYKYPLINESVEIYNELFKTWIKNKDNEQINLQVADKLRINRKKLIAIYFFNDNYDLNKFSTSSNG
jgi:hypothetical protein